ncbi:unnamed protein product [Darwinula stevensoni]|uniref:Glycolipid transfer protein domain-containing protein n=1 Tax=Darwinula stevensoni TaxID=69355 RepID=A0A7R9AFT5_9CRUS|nr:unnamed protein product [Darwinula stevensoni]CAG0903303.1 unnamed protein product [Darwinula stevensoni]
MSEIPQEKMEGGGHKDLFIDYPRPFPTAAEKWEVPTEEFLEASSGVVTILDSLGVLFYFPRSDVNTNVTHLKEFYAKDREKYSTLKSIVESEGSIEGPGTHRLLYLKRGLELTFLFFRYVLEDYDTGVRSEGTQDIIRRAYEETLEKHHLWIVRNTAQVPSVRSLSTVVSCDACVLVHEARNSRMGRSHEAHLMLFSIAPSRNGMISCLTYGGEGPETEKQVMENMRAWLANFSPCLEEVKDLFNSKGLESEESVVESAEN